MPIFRIDQRKIAYIHIPKTGGTSIETWLSSCGEMSYYSTVVPTFLKCSPQHFTLSYLQLLEPEMTTDIFSIVRDPYDRAESEYFYRTKNQNPKLRPKFSIWFLKHLDIVKRNPHHFDNHFMPQAYFVEDGVKVYRFEDGLDSIIKKVATRYEIPLPQTTPVTNVSKRTDLKWSTELLDRFNKYYDVDFKKFGYSPKSILPIN